MFCTLMLVSGGMMVVAFWLASYWGGGGGGEITVTKLPAALLSNSCWIAHWTHKNFSRSMSSMLFPSHISFITVYFKTITMHISLYPLSVLNTIANEFHGKNNDISVRYCRQYNFLNKKSRYIKLQYLTKSKLGFYVPFNSQGHIGTGPQNCHLWDSNPQRWQPMIRCQTC